jgi:hypothetical protein
MNNQLCFDFREYTYVLHTIKTAALSNKRIMQGSDGDIILIHPRKSIHGPGPCLPPKLKTLPNIGCTLLN